MLRISGDGSITLCFCTAISTRCKYIRCTTVLPPFSPKFEALFFKNDDLFMTQNTVRREPLLFSIFLAIYCRIPSRKTIRLLRWSTNRSIFWLLHKSGNADEPGLVPSIETSCSWKKQLLESTTGGVRPPISTFPSMSWPVLWHVAEHCDAGG